MTIHRQFSIVGPVGIVGPIAPITPIGPVGSGPIGIGGILTYTSIQQTLHGLHQLPLLHHPIPLQPLPQLIHYYPPVHHFPDPSIHLTYY
ncbi:hypothetical protein [Ectobacillus funiculus]|uniref:hypothetical protein n=1 Tax=Ectobacillus funiculus TaxID=137993 RepID=UPI0013EA1C93|nr:hypothetical protein [Ectobacillus funiculus]